MTPDEVPQALIDIVDKRAGKTHSRSGPVVACLAEMLTRYDEMKSGFAPGERDHLYDHIAKLSKELANAQIRLIVRGERP